MELIHKELTSQIIAAAIEVHNTLGPGFLESVYENAMEVEMSKRQKLSVKGRKYSTSATRVKMSENM